MSVVAFPALDPSGDRPTVAGAVDRFLDSLQAAPTRVGYAEILYADLESPHLDVHPSREQVRREIA
ncbi:hypothetical protein [Nocardia testacea]|uniref:hypothetical protein n=1 Tax=Nocardia testacea TaxID=248551 RepID=UPI000317B7AC|nr:hypothetical protein [Nocardia testacea]